MSFMNKCGVALGAALLMVSVAQAQQAPGGGPGGGGLSNPGENGNPAQLPEPSTWLLLSVGVAGIALASRAKSKKK